jgi:hypothetical protein
MPRIDETKLRRYYHASKDAHAAYMSAAAEVRGCRGAVANAKFHIEMATDLGVTQRVVHHDTHLPSDRVPYDFGGSDSIHGATPTHKRGATSSVVKDPTEPNKASRIAHEMLAAAEKELTLAIEREDAMREPYEHALSLWMRCKTYAEANGALPDDLKS